jgi:hypothetical protein
MKVFGIGLNKTGTTTLGDCLRLFGYRHASSNLELTRLAGRGDIEPVLRYAEDFDSFEDWPWPLVYRELDARFPGSKFILTVRRSSDAWLQSLKKHALLTGPTEFRRIAYGFDQPDGHEAAHLAYYETHNRQVRDYFAARPGDFREMCWERGDGWSSLCKFLGHPIPNQPFPHANRSDRKRKRLLLAHARRVVQRVLGHIPTDK